ncbi:TetR/AcrR family transcriptional regulator [Nocardioides mangrovi]|uniref:TetR family transcriptional regulator n=1 Tax=Nocardioides mangrovi TaxID=2874580 RepID=A0ABS7U8Q4_9ACTN|nr:TetR/AcrR family transcriptional regulator [Nocardioides mangrovi]MBZ5737250.1 hypothetical protein [Nocardioides mangrovi]
MPSLIDPGGRVDDLVNACLHLIDTEGVTALTVRKMAAVLRLSPSSLSAHLTNKHRMLDLVTKRVGMRLVRVIDYRVHRDGAAALVPDDDTLPFVRAWLGLVELSRADEVTGAGVGLLDEELQAAVESAYTRKRHDPDVEILCCVATGLWAAMCAADRPMSADRARDLITRAEASLGLALPPAA